MTFDENYPDAKKSLYDRGFGFYQSGDHIVRAKWMFDTNRTLLPEWQKVAETGAIWNKSQYMLAKNTLGAVNKFTPTAGDLIIKLREKDISLGSPTAKETLLDEFPEIKNTIQRQDDILHYEKQNNLISVTPRQPQTNFNSPLLLIGGVILLGVLLK